MPDTSRAQKEPTPVDDVRRVRERLTREAGGDIAKLAKQADRDTEKLRKKLRLRPVLPPGSERRRNKIAG